MSNILKKKKKAGQCFSKVMGMFIKDNKLFSCISQTMFLIGLRSSQAENPRPSARSPKLGNDEPTQHLMGDHIETAGTVSNRSDKAMFRN